MKRIYSLAVLLLFALSLSAQQGKSGALEKQLFILHTSDTHSRIEPISREAADVGLWRRVARHTLL